MAPPGSTPPPLRLGIVGVGGRGGAFNSAVAALGAHVVAVCDLDGAAAETAKAALKADLAFTDYDRCWPARQHPPCA